MVHPKLGDSIALHIGTVLGVMLHGLERLEAKKKDQQGQEAAPADRKAISKRRVGPREVIA